MPEDIARMRSLLDKYRSNGWQQLIQPMEDLIATIAPSKENRLDILRKRLGLKPVKELREGPYSRVFGNDSWYQLNLEYSEFLGRTPARLPIASKFYTEQYPFRILLVEYVDLLVEGLFSPPLHQLVDLYIAENHLHTLPKKIFAPLYQIDDLAILEPQLDLSDSTTRKAFSYIHPSIRFLELYADTEVRFLPDTLLESLSVLTIITIKPNVHRSFVAYCRLAHPDLNLYIEKPVPFHITHEKY